MSEKRRFTIESPKKEEGGNVFGISVGTYRQNASEKVSVNLNTATLSQIDLLVDGGFYSNRSDFINQALRETLDRRRSDIDRLAQQQSESTMENKQWFLGVRSVDKRELKALQTKGQKVVFQGYGLLGFAEDIPDELIFDTVEHIQVRGRVSASDAVKSRYGLK